MHRPRSITNQANIGGDYSDDEREFILAMERWMRKNRVRFPTFSDSLKVAISLGYRKTATGGEAGQAAVHPVGGGR